MLKKTIVAIAAVVLAMLGSTASGAGVDQGASKKVTVFKTAVSPNSSVKPGTTITATGKGAQKRTKYYCVLSVVSAKRGLTASNTMTLKTVTSNRRGKVVCKQTYKPWTAEDENGTDRHCPTTRRDRRAGFKCSVALADADTIGVESASVGYFTATK